MFNADELTTIHEAAEVTVQSLDRPTDDAEEKLDALLAKVATLLATPDKTPVELTQAHADAILDAVRREVVAGGLWRECQNLTLAQLCYAQADALVDDLTEDPAGTREVAETIRTLDELCDSHLADDLAGVL